MQIIIIALVLLSIVGATLCARHKKCEPDFIASNYNHLTNTGGYEYGNATYAVSGASDTTVATPLDNVFLD